MKTVQVIGLKPGGSSLCLRLKVCICVVLFFLPLLANAATDYVLTNGVITLSNQPPESLTGTFTLAEAVTLHGQHGDISYSALLALEFHSASATFTLRTGGIASFVNGEGSATFSFDADLYAVGLPFATVRLRLSGVADLFQNISITDTNETQQLGTMSFSAVAVPKPRLTISRLDGASIQIAWPTNFTDFRLEAATGLSAAASWELVTNLVAIDGNWFKISLPAKGGQRMYRLRKQ